MIVVPAFERVFLKKTLILRKKETVLIIRGNDKKLDFAIKHFLHDDFLCEVTILTQKKVTVPEG